MGLDVVGLVMVIEAEFGIDILNDRAAGIVTLGDLRDLVIELRAARSAAVDAAVAWDRIAAIMRRGFAIPGRHLVPGAALVADLGLD